MRIMKNIQLDLIITNRLPLGEQSLDLAIKIKNGFNYRGLPPIHVKPLGIGYVILDGRHRYVAFKLNNIKIIKARWGLNGSSQSKSLSS